MQSVCMCDAGPNTKLINHERDSLCFLGHATLRFETTQLLRSNAY